MSERRKATVNYGGREYDLAILTRSTGDDWLIFVHGWGCCKDCFDPAFEREEFAGVSLCAIDLLGFGESDKPRDFSYRLEEQAEILAAAILSLKPRRVYLVGHSMGGGVGLLAAPLLGEKLAAFISVEGSIGLRNGSLAPVLTRLPEWFAASLVVPLMKFASLFASTHSTRQIGKWLRQADGRALYRSAQALANFTDSNACLTTFIALPRKLYLCGARGNRLQTTAPLLKTKGIEVKVIPRAGHVMMLDNPEGFYRTLERLIIDR